MSLEESERIRELIATRHSKAAVELAKDLYKRCRSAESGQLLVDAYRSRIDDLVRLGMAVEAKALLSMVCERFPEAAQQFSELRREICTLDGGLAEVLAPLRDPNLPAKDREAIEAFIRQGVSDLPALAAALPTEHPLREAALALAAAFDAVTRGPVEDAVLALPQVARRSPLASWKAAVRAIACFYRCEDADCQRWLATMADDSLVARLRAPLIEMLRATTGVGAKLTPPGEKLVAAAADRGAALRTAVAGLDQAFAASKRPAIVTAVRSVLAASAHCDPGFRERLRQHIAVRALMLGIFSASASASIAGPLRMDAYYYRLLARALEQHHDVESGAEAVLVWERFRREAIREKWFAAGSLEDGVLSLHMAQLVERLPADLAADLAAELGRPGKTGERERFPTAGSLYERACQADPSPEAFQMWLNWAGKKAAWQVADEVAERWRQTRPADVQPLLYLMESAEKRSAFKKSLKYLEQAEQLDRLNPQVRRAKVRLLLASAIRHLRQRKIHLVVAEVQQLQTLPEVRQGENAGLSAGLRQCCAAIEGNLPGMREEQAHLQQLLGSVAAFLLTAALSQAGEIYPKPTETKPAPGAELLTGTARACLLGDWAGLPMLLPRVWHGPLMTALKQTNCPLDAAQMLVLGEAALKNNAGELAYAVSAAGLARGDAAARFLFLRARALPFWESERRIGCLGAALELARRERNNELTGRILEQLDEGKQRSRWRYAVDAYDEKMTAQQLSPELLSQILEEERELQRYPDSYKGSPPRYVAKLGPPPCNCAVCRGEVEDDDDEDDLDELDLESGVKELMNSLPPLILEQVIAAIEKGASPGAALAKTLSREAAASRTRQPARPSNKDQESLF